ncbi:galactose-3-O-sulfotransferase 3-like [Mizuhopecten yessoensis]|uniref:Galactose-3-O-sulfotransferase 3 n=1 Tax=Mizuhopecten yessoensis TaxID=6573 RepID=A0A210QHA7_MIZYE|nr:galactose-3-O-sulfotransferase 3-like [Mizuhopecten yessoensis]OWF48079.1 Galactose-3-O-sulfotransferase 3 [Mizuhopecten yessoensis]
MGMKTCFRWSAFISACLAMLSLVIVANYFDLIFTFPHRRPINSSAPRIRERGKQDKFLQDNSRRRELNGTFNHIPLDNPGQQAMIKHDPNAPPVHHVAFIKVHKAASTSIQNIFYRYGYHNDLVMVQPVRTTGTKWFLPVEREMFLPPPRGQTSFDIMSIHATYNRKAFETILPKDSVYIGIVREPFKQFASCVKYYHLNKILRIPGSNPVRKFLLDAKDQMNLSPNPRVFNTQSRDLGFPVKYMFPYNEYKFSNFLQQLDRELDLVLVVERFDESVVLLRRLLNWEVKDVILASLNSRISHPRLHFGATEEMLLKQISLHDYALYDFFAKKLQDKIDQQPHDFNDELVLYKQIKIKYHKFCLSIQKQDYTVVKVLSFERSAWSKPFNVTTNDCALLHMNERQFSQMLKLKMGHSITK